MSMAIRVKSAKRRATIAANMIKKQNNFYRAFDNCFEMGDGDEVMNCIIEKARKDPQLARAILEKMPKLGAGDYNTRLITAINECLGRNSQ